MELLSGDTVLWEAHWAGCKSFLCSLWRHSLTALCESLPWGQCWAPVLGCSLTLPVCSFLARSATILWCVCPGLMHSGSGVESLSLHHASKLLFVGCDSADMGEGTCLAYGWPPFLSPCPPLGIAGCISGGLWALPSVTFLQSASTARMACHPIPHTPRSEGAILLPRPLTYNCWPAWLRNARSTSGFPEVLGRPLPKVMLCHVHDLSMSSWVGNATLEGHSEDLTCSWTKGTVRHSAQCLLNSVVNYCSQCTCSSRGRRSDPAPHRLGGLLVYPFLSTAAGSDKAAAHSLWRAAHFPSAERTSEVRELGAGGCILNAEAKILADLIS